MALAGLFSTMVISCVIVFVSHVLWQYLVSPLRVFPGPFAAKLTNLWRAWDVAEGRPDITQKALHQQYGSAVRLGPNMISLSDPSLIKTIYNIKGTFLKSDFYGVNDVSSGGKRPNSNIFTTRSNEFHALQVKPIQKHYTMNGVLQCEPLVDRTTQSFQQILDERFMATGKPCPLDEYLGYYTWDMIGEITYGGPFGFIEGGTDIQGIFKTAEDSLDYMAVVGQIPWLDFLLAKNPIIRIGPESFSAVVNLSVERVMNRIKHDDRAPGTAPDYLDFFLEKRGTADWIDNKQVVGWLMTNMIAGADTTAITLRAIFYYVLKNPSVHHKLCAELDAAGLTDPVDFRAAKALPYLDAVVLEACRMHPGVGLPLERVVPAEGLKLEDGRFIPAGTIVGINAWVVHGNKDVFGQDADSFRPERWLRNVDDGETEDAFAARRSRMKATDFTFGSGNRICLGRHVSMLEAYKLCATLFKHYEITLVDPKKEWQVRNSWFVRQTGMDVYIKKRQ